jgi:hypothetical protein
MGILARGGSAFVRVLKKTRLKSEQTEMVQNSYACRLELRLYELLCIPQFSLIIDKHFENERLKSGPKSRVDNMSLGATYSLYSHLIFVASN